MADDLNKTIIRQKGKIENKIPNLDFYPNLI